jgi:hypothetical protein
MTRRKSHSPHLERQGFACAHGTACARRASVLLTRKDVIAHAEKLASEDSATESEGRRPGQVPRAINGYYDPPNDVFWTGRRRDFARGQLHLFRIQRGATFVKLPERDSLGRAR